MDLKEAVLIVNGIKAAEMPKHYRAACVLLVFARRAARRLDLIEQNSAVYAPEREEARAAGLLD